jgi:hypothetical protein
VVDQLLEHRAIRLDAVRERIASDEVGDARVQRLELAASHIANSPPVWHRKT